MQEIEPFYGWEKYYQTDKDSKSPFFGKEYNFQEYTQAIYGYYIHPNWDFIESETLYIKLLKVCYKSKYAIIEMLGEWNDTLHNDIMHFKRNVIDVLIENKIDKFILIGENVLNFHGSDDCYYEEWFEECDNGWIAAINFRDFVQKEWRKYNVDSYINCGGELDVLDWRTGSPKILFEHINKLITKRLD